MPQEIWKKTIHSEDYEVSNLGRVRSTIKGITRILKSSKSQSGYFRVTIKGKSKKIHILVLETFCGVRPIGLEACHNDGNKQNNCVDNLRWDTPLNNTKDKKDHGTNPTGSKNPFSVLTEGDVLFIRNNYKRVSYRKSNKKELAKKFNVSACTIQEVVHRRSWKHVL